MAETKKTASELDTVTAGFGIASAITIVINALLTIVKEMYPPLLAFMKSVSILGVKHHWLLHGLIIVLLFFILGWVFSKIKSLADSNGMLLSKLIAGATVLSTLGIFLFFLLELFH